MADKKFTVDARTILTLGRDSIKDHTTALVELVKNSYDADASNIEIEIMTKASEPYIRVADNGHGMTEKIVDDHWLRIGFSEKTTHTVSQKKRRRTGEKGIGRISADRLGSLLELHTKAKEEGPFGLRINWDDFDVKGRALESVNLNVLDIFTIDIPSNYDGTATISGTELIIRQLRQNWTPNDIEVLDRELSALISPFRGVDNFSIRINTDIIEGYNKIVGEHTNENYVVRLDINHKGADHRVEYTVIIPDPQKRGESISTVHSIPMN